MANEKKIRLGSGKLYVTAWDGSTIPDDATIETEINILGNIKGGASISYTPTTVTIKDDLGLVSETFLTNEEAILKSGILTWNTASLKKLVSTGTLTETATNRTLKIGGIGNFSNESYIIRFTHLDAVKGDLRVTIVGKNESGFELNFNQEDGTVIDVEFKAMPNDTTGTLIIIDEKIPVVTP